MRRFPGTFIIFLEFDLSPEAIIFTKNVSNMRCYRILEIIEWLLEPFVSFVVIENGPYEKTQCKKFQHTGKHFPKNVQVIYINLCLQKTNNA